MTTITTKGQIVFFCILSFSCSFFHTLRMSSLFMHMLKEVADVFVQLVGAQQARLQCTYAQESSFYLMRP